MQFDLNRLLQDELGIPKFGHSHGINAVRVKSITLMEKSDSKIRMTLTAREGDPTSNVSTYLKQSFFYHAALKSFDVISADIAIHYRPVSAGQIGQIKVIGLTGYGTSNLHVMSEEERPKFESYLKEWGILVEDDIDPLDDKGRGALYLLSKRIEAASGYMLPYLVSHKDKKNFSILQGSALLCKPKMAVAKGSICPKCLEEKFDPESCSCSVCGKVDMAESDVDPLEPDLDELFRKVRLSLGIALTTQRSIGESKKIWLLGEAGSSARKSKVIFASNLGTTFIELLAGWQTHIGTSQAIVITTSNPDTVWPQLPGLLQQPRFFSFRDHFQLVDKKLIVDSALKDATRPPAPGGVNPVFGPFSHDFRHVYLPGKAAPIKLSPNRATVFKKLWMANGHRVSTEDIVKEVYGEDSDKNMDDIFQKNTETGKESHGAFVVLVGHVPGYYWLKEEFSPE